MPSILHSLGLSIQFEKQGWLIWSLWFFSDKREEVGLNLYRFILQASWDLIIFHNVWNYAKSVYVAGYP